MTPQPTVFIVDDDRAMCNTLRWLVSSIGLTAEAFPSAETFLDQFDAARPGCVIVDVRMPGMGGLGLQRALSAQDADIPVIFVTGHGEVPVAVEALKRGAFDFLQKPFSPETLLERVRLALVADHERRLGRAHHDDVAARLAALTPREREVLEFVVTGLSSREIALRLGLTEKTIELHRSRVNRKLHVRNTVELVRMMEESDTGKS